MQASVPKRRGIPGGLLAPSRAPAQLAFASCRPLRATSASWWRRSSAGASPSSTRPASPASCLACSGCTRPTAACTGPWDCVARRPARCSSSATSTCPSRRPSACAPAKPSPQRDRRSRQPRRGWQGTARRLIVSLADRSRGGPALGRVHGNARAHQQLPAPRALSQRLGPADPARLGAELSDWGRYYDCRPQVMVGRIPEGYRQLARQGAYRDAGQPATITQRGPVNAARP